MKSYIKAQIEEFLQEKMSQARMNFDSKTEDDYEDAFDEFCENTSED